MSLGTKEAADLNPCLRSTVVVVGGGGRGLLYLLLS